MIHKRLDEIKARLANATPENKTLWFQRNPEKRKAVSRASDKRHYEKRQKSRKERESRPEQKKKLHANHKIRFAVKRGWLSKPKGFVFHHPDYERVYYGVWLTQKDHMRVHAGILKCPPCRDYTKEIYDARFKRKD